MAIEIMKEKSGFNVMVANAKAAGFTLVDSADKPAHTKKYVCPVCYKQQWDNAAVGAKKYKKPINKEMVRRAAKKAVLFINASKQRMVACNHCGYRKLEGDAPAQPRTITKDTVPTNPVTTAAKGMVTGSKKLRCKGVTAKGKQCAVMAGPSGYCRYHEDQATNKPTNPGF